jgi:hypothetical protein
MFFSDLPSFPHCGTAQENFFQESVWVSMDPPKTQLSAFVWISKRTRTHFGGKIDELASHCVWMKHRAHLNAADLRFTLTWADTGSLEATRDSAGGEWDRVEIFEELGEIHLADALSLCFSEVRRYEAPPFCFRWTRINQLVFYFEHF